MMDQVGRDGPRHRPRLVLCTGRLRRNIGEIPAQHVTLSSGEEVMRDLKCRFFHRYLLLIISWPSCSHTAYNAVFAALEPRL